MKRIALLVATLTPGSLVTALPASSAPTTRNQKSRHQHRCICKPICQPGKKSNCRISDCDGKKKTAPKKNGGSSFLYYQRTYLSPQAAF